MKSKVHKIKEQLESAEEDMRVAKKELDEASTLTVFHSSWRAKAVYLRAKEKHDNLKKKEDKINRAIDKIWRAM